MGTIEDVKAQLDIVETVRGYVPALKRVGRSWKAPCPFHSERTPSFIVDPDRGTWHCFGACATGGDVIGFVQRIEHLEFREALQRCAERAGVELRPPSARERQEREVHERLLRAKPDLVVLPRTSNPLWAERCRGAGLKVLVLSPESKASVATDIRLIAEALDSPKTQADRLTKELEGIPALKPAKLLIIWDGMMAGPDTYLAVILQRTGFRSALTNGGWIKLDWEILAQAQPDAVLWIESGPTDSPVVFSEKRKGYLSQVTLVKQLNFYKADLIFETSSGPEWLPGTGLLQIIPKLTALRGKMR